MKIGIIVGGPGIGDKIQFSSLPENYFLNTGKKLYDLENCWVYDHNPFVIRGDRNVDEIVHLWGHQNSVNEREARGEIKHSMFGISARVCEGFNLDCHVRHPRLYQHEDMKTVSKRIVVHTDGRSEGGIIPDHVIASIEHNYKGYEIYQIGGKNDRPTSFRDAKGLGLWDTAGLIASSEMFIGVNSSMMNMANCYPKVRKKIVVLQYGPEQLREFYPTNHPKFTAWIDFNAEYYNQYERDYGVTMSHKKI